MIIIKMSTIIASIFVDYNRLLIVSKVGNNDLHLILMDRTKNTYRYIARFEGSRCSLISKIGTKIFIGIDNKLLINRYDKECDWKEVLRASKIDNVFRCLTLAKGYMYCVEYGEPPTNLYRSKDGYSWEFLNTAQDIDRRARHYHSLAYDHYRDMLIVTIGDGCRTKVALSYDGKKFDAINTGMIQFLPIHITKKNIIFGMDDPVLSGITIYEPESCIWRSIFIKWSKCVYTRSKSILRKVLFLKPCPTFMSDLKFIDNNLWIAAFAIPQVVLVSFDLKTWYPLLEKSYLPHFTWATITEEKNVLVLTLGDDTFIIDKKEVAELIGKKEPIAYEYRAIRERFLASIYRMMSWR